MKPEIRDMVITALRSGDYQQGIGNLKKGDKFCCLGVVCDLHSKETGTKWGQAFGSEGQKQYLNEIHILPLDVAKWADMEQSPSIFKVPESERVIGHGINATSLTQANDNGISFETIASWFERELI